jgi:predicted NBD/HSP70 family sugar kinase
MNLPSARFSGSNAGRGRAWNRGLVLRHIRAAGKSGRAEIARASGLSTQTVSNIIGDLTSDGLLQEVGHRSVRRGIPVVQYAVAPDGAYALGIELRPNAIRAILTDLAGDSIWSERRQVARADPETVAREIAEMRDAALLVTGRGADRLGGIGIVMPGPFGPTGLSDSHTELPGWGRIQPGAWLEERLGLPVVIENDANAAAVAERMSGVAQSIEDFAFLYFGTGLGLGIYSDGNLVRGAFGNAGEFGHIRVQGSSLESVASRLALGRRLGAVGLPADTVEQIEAAADHPAVNGWVADAAAALSEAITIIENMLDPQTVVLGGALPDRLVSALIDRIELSDRSVSCRPDRSLPRLMCGAAGRMTATRGAAALVIERLFTPRIEAT